MNKQCDHCERDNTGSNQDPTLLEAEPGDEAGELLLHLIQRWHAGGDGGLSSLSRTAVWKLPDTHSGSCYALAS